tara:strand:- start:5079 stop:5678 length:600 start_codon:yes stop_codon:yes gene_type:complete
MKATTVVLSDVWEETLTPHLGLLHVINNPVSSDFTPPTETREADHLLLLGRNDPVKGHAFAQEIARTLHAQNSNLRLTMTGVETSEEPWVKALGWVPENEKKRLLRTASLLLVPSAYEGQPLVIFEALACGLPVLTSDRVPPTPDVVQRLPFENRSAWIDAIKVQLNQPIEVVSLVQSVEKYRIDSIARQWRYLYQKLE